MTRKAKDNPADRLPDWRATLPLAQAAPRCGARNRAGNSMPRTRHVKRAMPDARGQEHRTANRGGAGTNATREDEARVVYGRDASA